MAVPMARISAAILVFLIIAVVAFVQWLAGLELLADVALVAALYTVAASTRSPPESGRS
jgi:hypothetical protein